MSNKNKKLIRLRVKQRPQQDHSCSYTKPPQPPALNEDRIFIISVKNLKSHQEVEAILIKNFVKAMLNSQGNISAKVPSH